MDDNSVDKFTVGTFGVNKRFRLRTNVSCSDIYISIDDPMVKKYKVATMLKVKQDQDLIGNWYSSALMMLAVFGCRTHLVLFL